MGYGFPNNRLTCMQDQKTLSLSYNMHLFLPQYAQRLPNNLFNDSFFQTRDGWIDPNYTIVVSKGSILT